MDSKRILVVEDCRINTLLMKHLLAKHGFRVDSASTGEKALELVQKQHYELLFLDVMLPGIDGFEVCSRIRSQESDERAEIYFMTGMGESYSAGKVDEVDADGIFFKPIVPSQIAEVARRVMEKETLEVERDT